MAHAEYELVANGDPLDIALPFRAYGVIIQNFTAQYVFIADVGFIPPNVSGGMPLNGTNKGQARFESPPGVAQPGAVALQTCYLTFVDYPVPPTSGPTQGSALASVVTLERFPRASIPAAGNAGRIIQLTDYDKSIWQDDGTQFYAVGMQVINVRGWGAVGDSVTDDRVAVQDALNAVDVNGAIVFFPAPLPLTAYMIGSPGVTITGGSTLMGQSMHRSLVIGLANTGYSVVSTTSASSSHTFIEKMQFQAGGNTNTAVRILGTSRCIIRDCRFFGANAAQLALDNNNVAGAYGHRIEGCEFDTTTSGGVALLMTNTAGVPNSGITSTVVYGCKFLSDACVVYVNFGGGGHGSNQFIGNLFQSATGGGVGVGIDWTANCNADVVTANYFENLASAVRLASGAGTTKSFAISDNYFENCTAKITNNNTRFTTGVPKAHFWLAAHNAVLILGAPAIAVDTGASPSRVTWDFDAAADEAITFDGIPIPEDWCAGELVFYLYWINRGAGAGDVSWRIFAKAYSDGDSLVDTTGRTSPSDTVTASAQDILDIYLHSASYVPTAGELVQLTLRRNGSAVPDTLANDAGVVGVEIEYCNAS